MANGARITKMAAVATGVLLVLVCLALAFSHPSPARAESVDADSPSAIAAFGPQASAKATVAAKAKAKARSKKVVAPKRPTLKVKANKLDKIKVVVKQKGKVAGFQLKYRDVSGKVKTKILKKKSIVFDRAKINHTYKFKVRSFRLNAKGKRVYSRYSKVQRVFNGIDPLEASDITKIYHDSFVHGDKPRENQKYIVLHDTEAYTGPENIVSGWTVDNSGTVAAHYVVSRDGWVVQTAPTSKILHHAGWGGPGNFDEKFGVGNDDGEGDGDDMRGTRYLYGYTSYGMNSHSIGIEMCHVGGQDYPDEQLEAVDRLIARIDKYYGGNGGKIIDHKTWRPSNSDTDPAFADYLENYQQYRRHEK